MGEACGPLTGQPGGVSESPVPIVGAKLAPPLLAPRTLQRAALADCLQRVDTAALVAIVAPAGYGKTTAAVQLAQQATHPVAWLSLEPADDEPVRFWAYVASALCAGGIASADDAYRRLMAGAAGVADAITTLRASIEEHGERVTLVLDDIHVLGDGEVTHQLSDFLRHPVPNLRLVCTSRHDLALPVGRLRSQGQLAEARAEDLAFDRDESRSLLEDTFGVADVDDTQLDVLRERTQGWPVGMYLAGLSLRDAPDVEEQIQRFAGDTRHLSEYLAGEVLDGLDGDTRAFLLTTSIVHTLEADLCDELTGHPGSLSMLRRLLRDNVFTVALDEAATMFRYHPLLRENLESTLAEEHPELLPTLHARASRWFERNDDLDRAIHHATEAGDTARARHLISSRWLEFTSAGSFTTIERWIRRLGDHGRSDATVCLSMAWSMLNLGRYDEVDEWVDAATAAANDELEARLCRVEGATVRAHRARHLGNVSELVAQAEFADANADYDLLPEPGEEPERITGASGAALAVNAAARYWSGDLEGATAKASASVTHARIVGEPSAIVLGYSYLGLVAAETDDLDAALAHTDQALRFVANADDEAALTEAERVDRPIDERLFRIAILAERALVRNLSGDRSGARADLREAKTIADTVDARTEERLRLVENTIRFVPIDQPNLPAGARELTDKEQAVLALLPHQLSRRELAEQLHVSENTIKTHLTSIRHKLGVPGRGDLVERAIELGLLSN